MVSVKSRRFHRENHRFDRGKLWGNEILKTLSEMELVKGKDCPKARQDRTWAAKSAWQQHLARKAAGGGIRHHKHSWGELLIVGLVEKLVWTRFRTKSGGGRGMG